MELGESVGHGLRRLARKALASARSELRRSDVPSEEAIHAARKSVKKVRAIVRFAEAGKHGRLGNAKKRLRQVARTLSCLRDADAMLETLTLVRREHPALFSEHAYARLQRRLEDKKRSAVLRAGATTWDDTSAELRALRKAAKRWRAAGKDFRGLAPGIRRSHRRARRALARAKKTGEATAFHEWRKALKTLWYQLRVIGGGTPTLARDLRALHVAETALGHDHDLTVFCAVLSRDESVCHGPRDERRLQWAIEAFQRGLRKSAIASTRRVFAPTPRQYVRRARRAWRARKALHRSARRAA